jgi:mono/diheme cytochrome c family protein
VRRKLVPLLALVAFGCSKKSPPPPPDAAAPVVAAPVSATPAVLSETEGRALVRGACLSCHAEEMLAQQRLTPAQWQKTVTKMVGWGANLEPNDTTPLIAWLSATYGPDAGPYDLPVIDTEAAAREIAPEPDGSYGNGNPDNGSALYSYRCSGCHGSDARGHIGVRLVDRFELYRAAEFAETVRKGRGKMPPQTNTDAEIADILAYLRRLK